MNLDKLIPVDTLIPLVPKLAPIFLVVYLVLAAIGFLGALFSFSIIGMIGVAIGAIGAVFGYVCVIMVCRVYERVVGPLR